MQARAGRKTMARPEVNVRVADSGVETDISEEEDKQSPHGLKGDVSGSRPGGDSAHTGDCGCTAAESQTITGCAGGVSGALTLHPRG